MCITSHTISTSDLDYCIMSERSADDLTGAGDFCFSTNHVDPNDAKNKGDDATSQLRTESCIRLRTLSQVHLHDHDQEHTPEERMQPTTIPNTVELEEASSSDSIPVGITSRLFVSHFLSTWISRLFEMGAVLFIAAIYPNTLRPLSIYALVRSASAIASAPALGS